MSAPPIRRIVTGHDAEGHSVVTSDEVRTGTNPTSTLIWTTDTSPANNMGDLSAGDRKVGVTLEGGTIFRIAQFEAGHRSPMHRSNSVDYGLVLQGEVVLELDDGVQVRASAGDVVVQRGTHHTWINETDKPCVLAFILIDADPVDVNGKALEPTLPHF